MSDRSAVGQQFTLSSRTKWQRLLAGDTLCCPNGPAQSHRFLIYGSGPAYSTGELLNTPLIYAALQAGILCIVDRRSVVCTSMVCPSPSFKFLVIGLVTK